MISLRQVLAETNPELEDYSHNAFVASALPPLTTQQIPLISLYDLALMYRKSIDDTRNITFIQGFIKWLASISGHRVLPPKRGDIWSFSSLMVAGVNKFDLGSETLAFWHWTVPLMFAPNHMLVLNKFKGGYIFDPMTGIRSSRWTSIQKVLQGLQDGKGIDAV